MAEKGRATVLAAGALLGVALVSWLALGVLPRSVEADLGLTIARTTLSALFVPTIGLDIYSMSAYGPVIGRTSALRRARTPPQGDTMKTFIAAARGVRRTVARASFLGLALAAILVVGPVAAATAPRLTGNFQVTMTITAAQNSYNYVGQKFTRLWHFDPRCASGGCVTDYYRYAFDNTERTGTLKPVLKNGNWRYKGTSGKYINCYNPDGSLRLRGGIFAWETIKLLPRTVVNGNVTKFRGLYHLAMTPTDAGRAKGCQGGYVDATFAN